MSTGTGLRAFVAVKRVVDYAVKIRIRPDKAGAYGRWLLRITGDEIAFICFTILLRDGARG